MANNLYTKGKEALLNGSIVWTTSNIKVMFIDTTAYTPNLSTDTYVGDIPAAARLATSAVLANRTATGGVADADDITVNAVTASSAIEALILFDDTGNPATSRLLAYFDSASSSALPFTPTGGSVAISWPNTSGKIFSL